MPDIKKYESSVRPPTTWYVNPFVCARRIDTRISRGNGKLFTEVLDDDEIFSVDKNIDVTCENESAKKIVKCLKKNR